MSQSTPERWTELLSDEDRIFVKRFILTSGSLKELAAAYDVISGPAGKKRDWNREQSLFYPGALIAPTASVPGRNDVELEPQMLDVEKYIARV